MSGTPIVYGMFMSSNKYAESGMHHENFIVRVSAGKLVTHTLSPGASCKSNTGPDQ